MKICPFCANEIQDAAIKCQHCHSMLNSAPSAPPAAGAGAPPVVQLVAEPVRSPALTPQSTPPVEGSRSPRVLLTVVGVLGVVAVLSVGGLLVVRSVNQHDASSAANIAATSAIPASAAISSATAVAQRDASATPDPSDPPAAVLPPDPDATRYAATIYTGPVKLPDFTDRTKTYSAYRTRIAAGVRAGPNYAGDVALVEVGCGTNCEGGFAVNVETGVVVDLPIEGEDYFNLAFHYQPNSRLLRAQWQEQTDNSVTCFRQFFTWTGAAFESLEKRSAAGTCPEA